MEDRFNGFINGVRQAWNRQTAFDHIRDNPHGFLTLRMASFVFSKDPGNEEFFREFSRSAVRHLEEHPNWHNLTAATTAIYEMLPLWQAVSVRCTDPFGGYTDYVRFFRLNANAA